MARKERRDSSKLRELMDEYGVKTNQLSYISKISPIIISGISLLVSILALALSA